jgi:hypothetical protein
MSLVIRGSYLNKNYRVYRKRVKPETRWTNTEQNKGVEERNGGASQDMCARNSLGMPGSFCRDLGHSIGSPHDIKIIPRICENADNQSTCYELLVYNSSFSFSILRNHTTRYYTYPKLCGNITRHAVNMQIRTVYIICITGKELIT